MNHKQAAAKHAVSFIKTGMSIGLGAGATMEYMAGYLQEMPVENLKLFTSCAGTKAALLGYGFAVNEIADVSSLDIYFDGCDQFDKNLNALKSGAGIHTIEKLFASMAAQFILVGDETKYAESLETRFPLVLEVLPQAVCFVQVKVKEMFAECKTLVRMNAATAQPIITENRNYLVDTWFSQMPELLSLNMSLKNITGVVETSLFYGIASKAVIGGIDGIKVVVKT